MVTTDTLLLEMHLDPSETNILSGLIVASQDYIVNTTAKGVEMKDIIEKTNEHLFDQCTKALVSSFYHGDFEQKGISTQARVLLNVIRNMYAGQGE